MVEKGKAPIIVDNVSEQILEVPPFVEQLSKSQQNKRRQKKKKAGGDQGTLEQPSEPL